jgi:hypothetical protein
VFSRFHHSLLSNSNLYRYAAVVEVDDLEATERGAGGFGSTGV